MIKINKNFQIEIKKNKKSLTQFSNIFLRPYKKKNVLNGSWKWLNDKRITIFMDKGHKKHTLNDQLKYFKKINNSNKDILFAIYYKNTHIGNVGLHQINKKLKTAQFGIVIGNTRYHRKGIGKRVWFEIIKFGFINLNLKKIYTMIVSKNIASNKIAKNLGFKKLKKKFFLKKNDIEYEYPKFYLTQKLLKIKI